MIDRRHLLVAGATLALAPARVAAALPIPAGNRLGFDVLWKGTKLGSHVLTFQPAGDALTVQVEVAIAFKVGPITLFRYGHRATERWQGDGVVALDAQTDDNGSHYRVTARRVAGGFAVEGPKSGRYTAPTDALPATHWNRRELDGPWINTQDGRLMRPKVASIGVDRVATAAGGLNARHFRLTGDVEMDMWYDDRLGWAGLAFVKGGAPIRYERQA